MYCVQFCVYAHAHASINDYVCMVHVYVHACANKYVCVPYTMCMSTPLCACVCVHMCVLVMLVAHALQRLPCVASTISMNCIHSSSFACLFGSRAAMTSRPAKLARLQRIRAQLPYVSQSALAAVLQAVAQDPDVVDGSASRRDVRHARNEFAATQTPYGPVHQKLQLTTKSGGTMHLEIQHPIAMLHAACVASKSLSELVDAASACQPWRLILYADEILPGNQLAYKSARKMWCVYWSVLDWGAAALANEDNILMRHRVLQCIESA